MNVQSHPEQTAAQQDGLPVPRRYWSAAAIWLALTMAVLDGAIANVALPVIAKELGASAATSVWVINAYQLSITVLLLPLAALGDRIGYKCIYIPGLALFTLGSLGCALSGTLLLLILARVFQGIGAACIMSMNAALVRATYPAKMLGRGIGYNALVLSFSAAAGPTIAALILTVGSWPWLFLINLPIGIAAFVVARKALPDPQGHGRRFDWPSAVLSALMMGGLIFGAETLARTGHARDAVFIVVGLGAGAALLRREWSDRAPMIPLDLLRIRVFSLSILTSTTSFVAQMLAFVTMPFLLESVLGRGVIETGLLMSAWPVALGCIAPISGRLADKVPAGLMGGVGLGLFAAGLFALSRLGSDPSNVAVAWRMALCGLGFGLFQSPNNRLIVSSAPKQRSGAAGGMLATARLLGQTIGAVCVAAVFHIVGLKAAPGLLFAAAIAAAIAAVVSMMRMADGNKAVPCEPVPDME